MPGALKFTNSIILPSHKPYKFLHNFSSSATTTTTTTAESTIILRLNYSDGWRRRKTPYAPAARGEIASQVFVGRKLYHYSSDSRNRGLDTQDFCNSKNNLVTKMCATVDGKVENQSDVSPQQNHLEKPQAQPPKLLTLPTMLTIGRVAAVPLLVGLIMEFINLTFYFHLASLLCGELMNLGTPFGAFLDPVADKLMVAATLILLCTRPFHAGMFGQAPWLLTVPAIAIIGREITMSAVREWAASQDRKLLESCRRRSFCLFRDTTAIHFSMACPVVTGCVCEKDMESAAKIITYESVSYWFLPVITESGGHRLSHG
ncbi:hypothetical protein DH2020_010637 [Rehmannia glutinosa]|uniref:Uncharacterized protein n=1 Tax=Rehmannia glutinosa TaxID=99300 RepID=A0ABR0XB77_REHGL